jgi:hypothetical protein
MSNPKLSTCCSCGFQWPTGQHGEHSCSSYLRTENVNLKTEIAKLEILSITTDVQDGFDISEFEAEVMDVAHKALEKTA